MNESSQNKRAGNFQSFILIALIFVGVVTFLLLQTKNTDLNLSGSSKFKIGKPAPGFSLPNLDGTMVNLSDYKGKVVLLNIWATWCPPCVEEMPSMEKLFLSLNREGLEILAVSIDASGLKSVRPFMEKHKLSFRALIDPKGTMQTLFRTTGIPESIIIDKNGIVVEKIIGPRDWSSSEAIKYFRNLIKKK